MIRKKTGVIAIVLLFFVVLLLLVVIHFVKGTTINNGGKKLSEVNTTWGEFLDVYNKENPQEQANPRQDITKDHKVRVVKIEYPNGLESKAGFYNYALVTQVYDAKTGELLTSMGVYRDKK